LGALTVAAALCATVPLHAQLIERGEGFRFGLGVGATMPTGDFGTADKMGVNILGVFEAPLANSPLYLRVDGLYSSTAHEVGSGNTSLLGATVNALYHFSAPNASARPYALGGLGLYNADFGVGESQTKLSFGAGGGVTFNLAGFSAFAEARYMSIQTSGASTSFIPISVGLMFGY
jgi:hypothetical protein